MPLAHRQVVPNPGRRRLAGEPPRRRLLRRRRHHNLLTREAPQLAEVGPGRHGPEPGRPDPHGGGAHSGIVLAVVGVVPEPLPEDEGGRRGVGPDGEVGPGAGGGVGGGGEAGGGGAGAGGGDDGGLGLAEEPLDGLAVGLVPELARQLEDTCGADDRHADAAAAAVDLRVAVFRGRFLDGDSRGAVRWDGDQLVVGVAVGVDAVSHRYRDRQREREGVGVFVYEFRERGRGGGGGGGVEGEEE